MYYGKKLFGQVNGVGEEGLIAYWPLSSDALDDSGNGLDGTEISSPSYVTVGGETGIEFNQTSPRQYVSVADNDLLTLSSGFKISFYLYKYTDFSRAWIVSKRENTSNQEFQMTWLSSVLYVDIFDQTAGGYIRRTATLANTGATANAWDLYVIEWDGTTSSSGITIEVNSSPITTSDGSSGTFNAMQNTTSIMQIGDSTISINLNLRGVLKELKIQEYGV